MPAKKPYTPRRLAGWVIVREDGARVDYYAGPLVSPADRWRGELSDALGYVRRSMAHHALADYIDPRVDRARVVPVWLDAGPVSTRTKDGGAPCLSSQ